MDKEEQFEIQFRGTSEQVKVLTHLMTGGEFIQQFAAQQKQLQQANQELAAQTLHLTTQHAKVTAQNQMLLSGLVQFPALPPVTQVPPPPPTQPVAIQEPARTIVPPPPPPKQPDPIPESEPDLNPWQFRAGIAAIALFLLFSACFSPNSPLSPIVRNVLQQPVSR